MPRAGTWSCVVRRWRWRWRCSVVSRPAWGRCSASGSWRRSTRRGRGTGAGSTPWALAVRVRGSNDGVGDSLRHDHMTRLFRSHVHALSHRADHQRHHIADLHRLHLDATRQQHRARLRADRLGTHTLLKIRHSITLRGARCRNATKSAGTRQGFTGRPSALRAQPDDRPRASGTAAEPPHQQAPPSSHRAHRALPGNGPPSSACPHALPLRSPWPLPASPAGPADPPGPEEKQKPQVAGYATWGFGGAPCRVRTDDLRFTRALLWPAELRRRRGSVTGGGGRDVVKKRPGGW